MSTRSWRFCFSHVRRKQWCLMDTMVHDHPWTMHLRMQQYNLHLSMLTPVEAKLIWTYPICRDTYVWITVQALENTTKAIISSLFFWVEDQILRSVQRVTEIVTCCATRPWPASCCFASKLVPGRKVGRSWGRNAGACHVSPWEPVDFLLMSFEDVTWFWLQILDTSLSSLFKGSDVYYIGLQTFTEGNPNNFVHCILYALHCHKSLLAPFNLKTKWYRYIAKYQPTQYFYYELWIIVLFFRQVRLKNNHIKHWP